MLGKTILIADDEPHLLQIVAYTVRKTGAAVQLAVNGQECVELAILHTPDLIISDFQMPVLDGLQACIRLRDNPATARIPVLMLTARGHRLSKAELALTQIVELLPKPFSAGDLTAKIQTILNRASAAQVAA